jgi:hypothetical protein
MRLPDDRNKFTARFRYVEVAKYVDSLKSVIREKKDGQPVLIDIEEIPAYCQRLGNTGIYTSILQYDSQHLDTAASLGSLCFDLDANDLEDTRSEALKLVEYLLQYIPEGALGVYFSGGKGFHIECEPITLNVSSTDDLSGIYHYIAEDISRELGLRTTDLVVYDKRRMWRVVGSRHQRTGLFKVECLSLLRDSRDINAILEWAKEPHPIEIPEPHFNAKANQWYREYVYKFEESKKYQPSGADLLGRFLEQGAGNVRLYHGDDKVFDKFKLFKNCPAVRLLVEKAHTHHHLDHYERLFLCSLLTYTEDAIRFLHEILSQCHDYNPEISSSHIEDWVRRREIGIGGRPFTCDKARQVGIMCSGCDTMEPHKKFVLANDKLIETGELSSPSPVRHAYTIPRSKNVEY